MGSTMAPAAGAAERPLVEVHGLVKHFDIRGGILQRVIGTVQAVDGVSFDIRRGETLGLVGESGCGKTTVGRLLLRLIEPTSGSIRFDGVDITKLSGAALKPYRRRMQIIFQDPFSQPRPADARSATASARGCASTSSGPTRSAAPRSGG